MNISLSNWWSWGILLLLLMIVAVVDSRKRIPRKISIFILVPVLSVVIIFMMSENNKEAEQSFHTLEEAVTAYDDRSDVVATLRGKTSALVIMDDGDVMDSQIFENRKRLETSGRFRVSGHKAFYRRQDYSRRIYRSS